MWSIYSRLSVGSFLFTKRRTEAEARAAINASHLRSRLARVFTFSLKSECSKNLFIVADMFLYMVILTNTHQNYFLALRLQVDGAQINHLDTRIFKLNLRTVSDVDSPYASWVESNAAIRYCFGPGLENGGRNPGCSPVLRPGIDI